MSIDSSYEAALRQPVYIPCVLLRMVLASGLVVRLTDGGFAVYAGEIYLSNVPGIGSLDSIGQLTEGGSGATTRIEIKINPENQTAVSVLANPLNQTGLVQWWEGAMDGPSGQLIGQPKLKFQGQVDIPILLVDQGTSSVSIECGSESELQLIQNTDWRANDATHRRIWGELGHANVSRLTDPDYWRTEAPAGAISTITGGGGGGGGGTGFAYMNQTY